MIPHNTQLVIHTDYSGYFSVSVAPPPKTSVGLAVTLSETSLSSGDNRRLTAPPDLRQDTAEAKATAVPLSEASLQLEENRQPTAPPDLQQDTAEVKVTRRPRGAGGLTSYGKRLLVGAVNLLEARYGKRSLIFHTATLPTDDPALKREALRKSKQLLQYWRKVLSRLLDKVGLPKDDIVVVLELQRRGAVHLHTVFVNHYRRGKYVLSLQQLDNAWRQALTVIMPVLKQADFSKSCRTERVKKSAGRYLAKYLSKGSPAQLDYSVTWYSVGDNLKQRLKELAHTLFVSVRRDFDFSALAQMLIDSKLAWCLDYFLLDGVQVRSLFGYFNHRLLNFAQVLCEQVRLVNVRISDR